MINTFSEAQREHAFQTLSEELKDALVSIETADAIRNACEQQGIVDDTMGTIAEYTGLVLLGLLLPDDFKKALMEDLRLSQEKADGVFRAINRLVFYPAKPALDQLHRPVGEAGATLQQVHEQPAQTAPAAAKEKLADKYRESAE